MYADDVAGRIEGYLATLRKALTEAPAQETDEIIEEFRTHIAERLEAEGEVTEQTVNQVLRAVGDPRELASHYKREAMLRRAATSKSPWLLLRTTLRWATTGLVGAVAFAVTATGYGCAAVAYLCALLKPILPAQIGLWLGPEHTITLGYRASRFSAEMYGISVRLPASFALGTLGATEGPARELLGPWLFPVTLLLGVLFVFVTGSFTRWFIRRFGRLRLRPSA